MTRKKPEEDRSRIRCAIYTRKSTEERLAVRFERRPSGAFGNVKRHPSPGAHRTRKQACSSE
jgi:hypothetical protein